MILFMIMILFIVPLGLNLQGYRCYKRITIIIMKLLLYIYLFH